MLNSKQVEAMFKEKAFLVGQADAIPDFFVAEMLGADAVAFVKSMSRKNGYVNGYGIGDYTLMYLTYRGFQVAATYCNIVEAQGWEDAIRGEV